MSKVTRDCRGCGNPFDSYPSQNKKFCSRECRKNRVVAECQGCGEQFERPASQMGKFCSDACWRRVGVVNVDRECKVEGCSNSAQIKGMCPMHYQRQRLGTNLTRP